MRLRCTVDRIAQFRLRKHGFGLSLSTGIHKPPEFFADGRKLSLQPLPLADCRLSSSLLRQEVQLDLAEIGHLCTQPTRGTAGRESSCQSGQLLLGGTHHYQADPAYVPDGLVAEWLRRGLQILAPRFDSGRGLHLQDEHLTLRRSWREVRCAEMSGSTSILYPAPRVGI